MGCQQSNNQQSVSLPFSSNKGPVSSITLDKKSWNRAYEGLFDFQTADVHEQNYSFSGQGLISIVDHKVLGRNLNQLSSLEKANQVLFKLQKSQNYYKISPFCAQINELQVGKEVWVCVNHLPQKSLALRKNDNIKLGKRVIKIRQLIGANQNTQQIVEDNIYLQKAIYDTSKQQQKVNSGQIQQLQVNSIVTESQKCCRICLDPGQRSNPLITPCKCQGSVKYIHLKCLKTWLNKRFQVKKTCNCIMIVQQQFSCQMCQMVYDQYVLLDGKKYYIVDIPKIQKPYAVIEMESKAKAQKIVYFVSFKTIPKITIGRKKNCDVVIGDDVTVSRNHAYLSYQQKENSFKLADNKSKFGTLVEVRKHILARPNRPISIMVNNILYIIKSNRSSGSISQYEDSSQLFLEQELKETQQQASVSISIKQQRVDPNPLRLKQSHKKMPSTGDIKTQLLISNGNLSISNTMNINSMSDISPMTLPQIRQINVAPKRNTLHEELIIQQL